eukprot:TRINITY_DN5290_c0_g1_i1.p1 TRINITY_DN5290_c0_g1~~TRINITY_DN5290_c0_g1_i1.p1  ORF type:complete len:1051 (-),score=340.24 TRINITY_DN5290_c0_g1_i1:78-2822(-)
MKWSEQELQKWADSERQKEDDNMTLLKYSLADETKVKDLSLNIEKLSKEVLKREQFLEMQLTETHAGQIEINKVEQQLRDLHKEHQQLIRECEETLQRIRSRSAEVEKMDDEMHGIEDQIKERQQAMQDRQRSLERERLNNQQLEAEIALNDRQVTRKRAVYGTSYQGIQQLQDELDTIRMTLQKTKSTVDLRKEEVHIMANEIESQQKRLEASRQQLDETKERSEIETKHTDELGQSAKDVEIRRKHEEGRLAQVTKELEALKQEVFRASQDLHKARQTESNLISEIQGTQTAAKNLQGKIHKLDSESMKQQELVYNQEFQLQELEHRISRAQGERTNQEKADLNSKIQELTQQLRAEVEKYHVLTNQQKKILDDVRVMKREAAEQRNEKQELESKIQMLIMESESVVRNLKQLEKQKEDLMIQENCVRLDVRRLRDLLYKHADEVYSLESWKRHQALDLEETKHNMVLQLEALRAQLRVTQDDKHKNKVELKAREIKVDKLRKKYELMMSKMGSSETEDGEERTQAYYVIKAAQEKEELRAQGDDLDIKIDKAEQEIVGLEKTLQALNTHNQKLHALRTNRDVPVGDFEQKLFLEQELQGMQARHRERMQAMKETEQVLEAVHAEYANNVEHSKSLNAELAVREQQLVAINREIAEGSLKVERAKRIFAKLVAEQKKAGTNSPTPIEEEYAIERTRDELQYGLLPAAKLAQAHPELYDEVLGIAQSLGLELPDPSRFGVNNGGSGRASSRSSSAAPSPSPSPPGSAGSMGRRDSMHTPPVGSPKSSGMARAPSLGRLSNGSAHGSARSTGLNAPLSPVSPPMSRGPQRLATPPMSLHSPRPRDVQSPPVSSDSARSTGSAHSRHSVVSSPHSPHSTRSSHSSHTSARSLGKPPTGRDSPAGGLSLAVSGSAL